ncbi:MAG: N-acetyl-gamma-glutamyl-phosphate reductase, partial [Actinobacteria bacterium]
MVDVAVIGAAGYSGIETVRWVLGHPSLRLTAATSGADAGKRLDAVYPALVGRTDAVFTEPDVDAIASAATVALLAVPHTAAMAMAPALLERGVTVVDLSADFRLTDAAVYEAWYGVPHAAADLLASAVYGLPELTRDALTGARLVACPGCYPTATALAALPVLEAGLVVGERGIVDAKSGVSGAGRSATAATPFCSADEALAPYQGGRPP